MPVDLDIVTLIFFVLAVVIFIQLRNVLGQRTGHERPPQDGKDTAQTPQYIEFPAKARKNKTITIQDRLDLRNDFSEIDAYSPVGSAVNQGLRSIRQFDEYFSPVIFCQGAKIAYEKIMVAFAKGNKSELEKLLSPELYEDFSAAIDERELQGNRVEFSFIGIDKIEIKSVTLDDITAFITVQIVTKVISATYDKEKNLIEGDPQTVVDIYDLWTFSRIVIARDPNWTLVATEDGSIA